MKKHSLSVRLEFAPPVRAPVLQAALPGKSLATIVLGYPA
jgi:hypothetical protein